MRERVIGIAEMAVSATPGDRLVTYALGSCIGLAVHDPVARVGGLLHAMLPHAALDPAKARDNPCTFLDTGVPALIDACARAGANPRRLVIKAAGGAFATERHEDDQFQIGRRNMLALRALLARDGTRLAAEDVGGQRIARTMLLDVATGSVSVRANGGVLVL